MIYDYIIVGGGIAGLYANYLLSNGLTKDKIKYKCLLLEKNDYLGGRMKSYNFYKTNIKLGAGIADDRCLTLFKLLDKLKLKYIKYPFIKHFLFYKKNNRNFNINHSVDLLDAKIKKLIATKHDDIKYLSVKDFIIKYFGFEFFRLFALYSDYYDYFNSDIRYYQKHYDITENKTDDDSIFSVNWDDLIKKLTVGNEINNFTVDKVVKEDNIFIINDLHHCNNIIFALTQKTLDHINKNYNLFDLTYSSHVNFIPFVRIYSYHKDGYSSEQIKGYTITDTRLQKIIPINDKVIMISYCDNFNAEYWYELFKLDDKKLFIKKIKKELKKLKIKLEINDFHFVYWHEGVPYFNPTKEQNVVDLIFKLQHPTDNISVVGDFVSLRHGLVDGALQSVEKILL
jgi:protoporphyrinogen oxidase